MGVEIPMFWRILIMITSLLTVVLMASSSRIFPWFIGKLTHRAKSKLSDVANRLSTELPADVPVAGPTEHPGTI
ncbi:hypothetical protein ACFLYF_00845 [Chloroflexota bacterium]